MWISEAAGKAGVNVQTSGAQPILVLTGKGEKTLRDGGFPRNTVIFPDLAFAASALLVGD